MWTRRVGPVTEVVNSLALQQVLHAAAGTQERLVAFKRVAAVSEVPDSRGLRLMLGELEIGLYRVGEDYFAMDNVCPHAGYPLCDGELEGSTIMCPGHGWVFDVQSGLAPGEVEETPLTRYPVRVEGDDVLIDVDEPLEA